MPRFYMDLPCDNLPRMIELAQAAETAGMDGLWASQLYSSPFVPLAAVAGSTQRIKLGTSVALAFVRSPMETALNALDLDRITDGRFILGLGSGLPRNNKNWYGVADYGRPAPHMKECAQAIRHLLSKLHTGEPIRFQGDYYNIDIAGYKSPYQPVRENMPIYFAGIREGMARAAGEVADGLLGHMLWSQRWLKEVIMPNVAIGIKRCGRKREDFDISGVIVVLISKDRRQARRDVAELVAFYATVRTYEPVFTWHGFQKEAHQIREAFIKNQGFSDVTTDLVSDEMIDVFGIAGTADEARKRVEEYGEYCDSIAFGGLSDVRAGEQLKFYEKAILETFGK